MPLFKRYYNKYKSKVNLMSVTPYPNNINTDIEQKKTKSYSLDKNELTNIFNNIGVKVDNFVLVDEDTFEERNRQMIDLINQINNNN
jgi:Tfp pilus assembly major pilin PilA